MAKALNTPEERANHLLLQHLNAKQKRTFKDNGWFEFVGSKGNLFRLYSREALDRNGYLGSHHRLWEMSGEGPYLTGRDIFAADRGRFLPDGDTLLAVKLLIEVDELNLRIGCQVQSTLEILNRFNKKEVP